MAFWTLSASGELWQHLAISSRRALIGFSIGGSLGLILGLISGLSHWENGCWIPPFRCCATCRIWR